MSAATLQSPLTRIRLGGQLRQFGKTFELAVNTPREAIKALCVLVPGFERFLANARSRGLEFAVFNDRRNVGEAELGFQAREEIRIVPVVAGSKRAGTLQTIVGIVMIAAAAFYSGGVGAAFASEGTAGFVAHMGAAMALGGVMQLLSPQPKGLSMSQAPENTPGYAFGAARNTTASGNPVPLCVGKRRWGGAIISAAIYAEDRL
ncbi:MULTISPECIES: tail assembly protein [unclassified Pseudomonas]|uniref:tail assembly protein n=1 Tax=unclassified Pseudomonas TaxID=196821 RepID=UPI00209762E8|nr:MULTISPECIES: tail assembly protein [unclassified Pseudomonas]MCO7518786.1 tail assembly protein [Pseudomonas sp. 1]MCO7540779.1 tail assembly protein [Pseudomonas sp. VA159-2]